MNQTKNIEAWVAGERELGELVGVTEEELELLKGRAQYFLDGGHDERALMMLEMIEALSRKEKLATLLAVEVLLRLGRSDAAEQKIEALLARDPDDADALVAKAELLIATGAMAPAAELLTRVLAADGEGRTAAGARARAVAHRAHTLVSGA